MRKYDCMNVYDGPNIITDNLLLYLDAANYKSYPDIDSTVYDLSPNQRDFTILYNLVISNNIFSFDGVGARISRTESFDWTSMDFTLSAFTYTKSHTYPTIFDLIHAGNGHLRVLTESTPKFNFRTPGGSVITLISGGAINLNTWIYLSITKQANVYSIYINDKLENTNTTDSLNDTSGMSSIHIGYSPDNDAYDRTYYGDMSNIAIYERALTENEIVNNYNILKGRFGL